MRFVGALVGIFIIGCSSPAQQAKDEYDALRSVEASDAQLCNASERVAVEYAKQGNRDLSEHYQIMRNLHCLNASYAR